MPNTNAKPFHFKQFIIEQDKCTMKVGTDGVLLGAWANVDAASKILDIGAGSGVIAIMLAQRTDQTKIDAIEIDKDAFEQTKENMKNSPWSDQLEAFHMSIQDYAKTTNQTYNLIVSNPPFFSGGTFSLNQDRNSVRHTIKLAHGDLLRAVKQLLEPDGKFCLILPYIEGLRFQELARSYNFYATKITKIKPKEGKPIERLLIQLEKKAGNPIEDELIIQKEARNEWTEEYIALTKAFYLKM